MDPRIAHRTQIAVQDDPRITRGGRLMRRLRLDELPQLWNILRGEMSFVGPRPEVPGFHDLARSDDRIALSARPGLTGPATLRFRDEARLLGTQDDPDGYYRTSVFPAKVRVDRSYVEHFSLRGDLWLLARTARALFGGSDAEPTRGDEGAVRAAGPPGLASGRPSTSVDGQD